VITVPIGCSSAWLARIDSGVRRLTVCKLLCPAQMRWHPWAGVSRDVDGRTIGRAAAIDWSTAPYQLRQFYNAQKRRQEGGP